MPKISWLLAIAGALAAAGCSSNDLAVNPCSVSVSPSLCGGLSVGGQGVQVSAVLLQGPFDGPAITVPDTVHAGAPFSVTFYTVYAGCITPDGESLETRSRLTAIIPLEKVQRAPGVMCPDWTRVGPRSAEIALSDLGTDTVQVIGQGGELGSSTMDTVSATTVVVP